MSESYYVGNGASISAPPGWKPMTRWSRKRVDAFFTSMVFAVNYGLEHKVFGLGPSENCDFSEDLSATYEVHFEEFRLCVSVTAFYDDLFVFSNPSDIDFSYRSAGCISGRLVRPGSGNGQVPHLAAVGYCTVPDYHLRSLLKLLPPSPSGFRLTPDDSTVNATYKPSKDRIAKEAP